jgi:virulence-associated protein VapD
MAEKENPVEATTIVQNLVKHVQWKKKSENNIKIKKK